ncbi:MAG TPA: S41 family peptidase, partial [Verrucomicrobiae bacterium]
PRDAKPEAAPAHAWEKRCVVLMNEHSYSNGEIFPYAMRARGLARLVGMPTPGYVIWTDSLPLVDGTTARMPQSGFYRLDGTPQENNGEKPDVQVPLSPEDWLAGRDPQLDKAIEMLQPRPEVETVAPTGTPTEP